MPIENQNPTTYLDWAKTRDPDGSTADIVEVLNQENPILEDIVVRESNMTEGHRVTIRADRPRGTWTGYNEGVQPTKAASRQVDDRPGYNQAYHEIDKKLVNLENDKSGFMMSEASAQLGGMAQDHAEMLFYGNTGANPKHFTGMMPRYNSTSLESARQILNGKVGGGDASGDDGDLTSIYSITWGLNNSFEFFPKGAKAGLSMTMLGEKTLFDEKGGRFQGYRTHFEQWVGFSVKDWRSNYRIANISMTELQAGSVNIPELLIRAQHRLRGHKGGTQVIYCNEAVYTMLDLLASQKAGSNVHLTMREWAGEEIVHFRGIPIRMCEAILETEDSVQGLVADDGAGGIS